MSTTSVYQDLVLTNRWCLSPWGFVIAFHEVIIPSTALAFSSRLFTVVVKASIVIANVEEYGGAGVSDLNDFGVALSFSIGGWKLWCC